MEEIKPGDVACLKADKDKGNKKEFTVGTKNGHGKVEIYWYYGSQGELRSLHVSPSILHKIR